MYTTQMKVGSRDETSCFHKHENFNWNTSHYFKNIPCTWYYQLQWAIKTQAMSVQKCIILLLTFLFFHTILLKNVWYKDSKQTLFFVSTNICNCKAIYIILGFCYLPFNSSYCWKTPHRNSCMLSGPSGNTNANSPWASHPNDANCYVIPIWNQHVFERLVAKYNLRYGNSN